MNKQPTALLVEDDGAIREALTELLETTGYQVNAQVRPCPKRGP